MNSIRNLIADDSFAIGFQSMGQYRTALLKALDVTPPAPEAGEVGPDYDQEGAIAAVILDHSRVAASLGYPDPERNLGRVLCESDFGATARAILTRWSRPAAPPPLPANYIDREHQGEDLELLQTFYQACNAEGGTADEIHLRGLRAVLAARPTTLPAPEVGEVAGLSEYEWKDIGDGRPVRVQRCDKCGVCPSNVDDCGRFGDSRCPYFGVDAMASPPAPEVGEVEELVAALTEPGDPFPEYRTLTSEQADRIAAPLQQQQHLLGLACAELDRMGAFSAAPAPAVAPVAVSERLPDPRPEAEGGDCDDDGFCWFGYGYRLPGEDEKDSYAMWMLMPPEESRYGEVWVRASAIPLPQVGEVQA